MDTTSNNYTWQTFTFGGNAGSCSFYDCTIVNDTLAYAVGNIYLNDSTGKPDPLPYNFAQWNGKEWKLKRIAVEYKGNQTIAPLTGIFVLEDGKIILSSGLPYLPDGNGGWKLYHLWDMGVLNQNDGSVNHIWGTSINNLYFAGNKGTIVRYSNGTWQKIESGTSLQFLDIYGATDPASGKQQILAVCTQDYPPGKGIFSIQGNTATEISSNFNFPGDTFPPDPFGVWFVPGKHYYIVGDGIYEKHSLSDRLWKNVGLDITKYATTKIRGTGLNDIYVAGAFGEFLHFNGAHWISFRSQTALGNGSYTSVVVKGNLIIAVGANYSQAVITISKRVN